MYVSDSDPRVLDAVQRWAEMPKVGQHWWSTARFKFHVSPERDAGVLVEIRERGRFACVATEPYQGFRSTLQQPKSTAPDVAVWFGGERRPLSYVGNDRIIGAYELPEPAFLLVNLGMEVAFVITYSRPRMHWVAWSGPGNQVPELREAVPSPGVSPSSSTHAPASPGSSPHAPVMASPGAQCSPIDAHPRHERTATQGSTTPTSQNAPPPGHSGNLPLTDKRPPAASPTATPASSVVAPASPVDLPPPNPRAITPSSTPWSTPAVDGHSGNQLLVDRPPSATPSGPSPASATRASSATITPPPQIVPPTDGNPDTGQSPENLRTPDSASGAPPPSSSVPRNSEATPLSATRPEPTVTAASCPPDPPRASVARAAAATDAAEVQSVPRTAALNPIVLSEEVTLVLIRHLRHAATVLPIAKGADYARLWLVALEHACGDMAGIGDVVGGSMALFTPLYEGGHLAVMPSTVSASATAKLLVVVTPLVEQISRRRYALRVSALLDPQSAIFRKLAKRAPASCRLAGPAPPAPASTRRVRKPNTGSSSGNPTVRRARTADIAAQLAAAEVEILRLQADVAELRLKTASPDRDPGTATPAGKDRGTPKG